METVCDKHMFLLFRLFVYISFMDMDEFAEI